MKKPPRFLIEVHHAWSPYMRLESKRAAVRYAQQLQASGWMTRIFDTSGPVPVSVLIPARRTKREKP